MVSGFSAAGASRREETGGFSLGRVCAAGCTVGAVAVQTVPRWKRLVQAAVALLVLLSPQAFLLLMFPAHAQNDLSAIGEQSAAFHESANLVAGAAAQVRQHSVHIPASWAEEYLREEQASP